MESDDDLSNKSPAASVGVLSVAYTAQGRTAVSKLGNVER